ncbi:MAG: hypothetical protein WC989_04185 [Micavibrio sp.]
MNKIRAFFSSAAGTASTAASALLAAGTAMAAADEIIFIKPVIAAGERAAVFRLLDDNGHMVVLKKDEGLFSADLTDMAIACGELLQENGVEIAKEHLYSFIVKDTGRDYGNKLDESIAAAVEKARPFCDYLIS